MHLIQFREIMRDAEVAYVIHPIVCKYLLTVEETTKALNACGVPRAANVAQITSSWYDPAANFTERKSIEGRKDSRCRAAISVDNLVSKNDWRQ
jgi:hypothetical protein